MLEIQTWRAMMEGEIVQGFASWGPLGLMVIVLLIAVKVLYTRNTGLSDKFIDVVQKNTEAFNKHADTNEKLAGVIQGCGHNKKE
jgi:hypothetical protein